MVKKLFKAFGQLPLFEERMMAFFIDCVISFGLGMFPKIGWIFGLIYFLLKDSLYFNKGQSFGKQIMKIRVVCTSTNESLINYPQKSIIRNLILLIPFLNLVEIYFFLFRTKRLGDIWSETSVVSNK